MSKSPPSAFQARSRNTRKPTIDANGEANPLFEWERSYGRKDREEFDTQAGLDGPALGRAVVKLIRRAMRCSLSYCSRFFA